VGGGFVIKPQRLAELEEALGASLPPPSHCGGVVVSGAAAVHGEAGAQGDVHVALGSHGHLGLQAWTEPEEEVCSAI